ncbi:hypothetical protein A5658_10375 [Mycobacterium sp. 1245111.1]|uniref:tetratricopeptide repeat protein n=1 Tax=Mycobacterium sp. 1245111.1 TaxID=1834073 RepID=UPI000801C351|nr:hypothetical protein [Mycobacterium sp. 1245111.1]OBK34984.1 hypothetical protein A5658_10375 [Mycobacterium sp. 1245111.1]
MSVAEPIIVVLGPWCGGTSAVAKVLHHLGVLMGTDFDVAVRELEDTWEDSDLGILCRRAFSTPGAQLQMDVPALQVMLRNWADKQRRAAHVAGRRPGAKHPVLCVAVELLREAWGPIVPVVVDRPTEKVVASLNRLGWWKDEQERVESTQRLIAARDQALIDSPTVRVDFEELRATPAVAIRRLADELNLDVTEEQFQNAVNSVVGKQNMPRGVDPHQQLIDQYLPRVENDPDDSLSVHLLAQTYFLKKDFANARKYSERLIEIGVEDEDEFFARLRIAQSMENLDVAWLDVQDAYLKAWEFRPNRAEPFFHIARNLRAQGRYRLGYLFAKLAADMPLPAGDMIINDPALYAWRALDEQAVCASQLGQHAESFALCRRLLQQDGIPDEHRDRIAANRDLAAPAMLEASKQYPEALVRDLTGAQRDFVEVTISTVAGRTPAETEATLNSVLNCCRDVAYVGRFLVFDHGDSPDRTVLRHRFPFLDFVECPPGGDLREHIQGRYWLHVDPGWLFFAPDNYITRIAAVFNAEPHVFQVGVNFADATTLTGASASEKNVRRAQNTGRYVITDVMADGPAMFDTERLDRADENSMFATLDEVLCLNPAD